MNATLYSPEPARDRFIDLGRSISEKTEIAAMCLLPVNDRIEEDETAANKLHGASFMADFDSPDEYFLSFLAASLA